MLLGFYGDGIVRSVAGHQLIWSVNSVAHLFNYRADVTPDHSTNSALFAIPTFSETWHNNHRHTATSPKFSHRRWEIDHGW